MRGRPVGGVLKIAVDRVRALPVTGTMSQVARFLGVSYTTVRLWSFAYALPSRKIGNVIVVDRDELETWLRDTGRLGA